MNQSKIMEVTAMSTKIIKDLHEQFTKLKEEGLYKQERVIVGPQAAEIKVSTGEEVLNFCANNYLGLSSHPAVIEAAQQIMNEWGYGLSSVRFICGTQQIHKELEKRVSAFLHTEDTILYAACFDANGGVLNPCSEKIAPLFLTN